MVKKLLLLSLNLLLLNSVCFGAVAHVESFYNNANGTNPMVTELTISSSTNGILIVTAEGKQESDFISVTAVTWNGDSMTQLTDADATFYLLNPDSGTHDLSVTHDSAYDMYAATTLYSGVAQESPAVDSRGTGATIVGEYYTPVDSSITSLKDNSMIYAVGNNHWTKRYVDTNGYTIRSPSGLVSNTTTTNRFIIMDLMKTSVGSSTFEYLVGNDGYTWEIDMVVLEPVTSTFTPYVMIF